MNSKKETVKEAYENYKYALHHSHDNAVIEKYCKIWEALKIDESK